MVTFLKRVERWIDGVYSSPNPQVGTYFRDLRVAAQPLADDDDDDSKYRYEPEPNAEVEITPAETTVLQSRAKLSTRNGDAAPLAATSRSV